MESLEKKTCEACTIDAPKVTDAEKIDFLDQITDWSIINHECEQLQKVYKMPDKEKREKGILAREWAIKNFSIQTTGKLLEDFIDNAPYTDFDFESLVWKPRNPKAKIPNIAK